MERKENQTSQNLYEAFLCKAHSKNLFDYYAYTSRHEGYAHISDTFTASAKNDGMNSKIFYKLLNGPIPDTKQNLQMIIEEDLRDGTETYPAFAQIAREEGFEQVAYFFEEVARVHCQRAAKYKQILKNLESDAVFTKSEARDWVCKVCGYTQTDHSAPEACPVCRHGKRLFSLKAENF